MAKKLPGDRSARAEDIPGYIQMSKASAFIEGLDFVAPKDKAPPKPKPRRISRDTAETLELLSKQIEAAQAHLRKMPGAIEPDVWVKVNHLLQTPQDANSFVDWILVLFETELAAAQVIFEEERFRVLDVKRLTEFPTRTRIELAAEIPELIRIAKDAESGIRARSSEVITNIEKAIVESMEEFE